ncbi:MAG TPA: hypothetical protein VH436_29485 [Vicinamibacterales bacterium]
MPRSLMRRLTAAALAGILASACSQPAAEKAAAPAAAPAATPTEGADGKQLSALAPATVARMAKTKAPFDLTGNWFIDVSTNPEAWRFGPPYPKLTAASQVHWDAAQKATKEGKVYRDDIGQCWPAGLPLIMTRYWPMAMVQIPSAIYMISGFMNSVRIVYLDGRKHTDLDIIVRTYNGESIGHWDGNDLVVDTIGFRGDHHWMDQGGVAIPAGEQLHIVERMRMVSEGKQLEIEYTMTDPEHWEGEWKSTKRFNRVDDEDIQEVSCLPDLNEHIRSTTSKTQVLQ